MFSVSAVAVTINQHPALTVKQRQAALMLASGTSKKAIAKTLGIAAHTVSAWVKLPAFNEAVNQHLATVEGEALQVLRAQKLKALDTLTELMDEQNPPATRLAAVQAALGLPAPATPPALPAPRNELHEALVFAADLLVSEGHIQGDFVHEAVRH